MRIALILLGFVLNMNLVFAQERQWSLDASEREAFLVFGVPDTDDVGLSFWCEIGKGKISLFAPITYELVKQDRKIRIDVAIDDQNFNIIAKASRLKESGTASVEAIVDIDGTVMQAAAKSQTIAITAFGHKSSYPLIDADVAGLQRVCGGDLTAQ